MDYIIKKESKFQKALKQVRSKSGDVFLSGVMFLAKISKSEKLSRWIERYTEKKVQQLQQEIIRMKWNKVTLEKATAQIHSNQKETS